MKYNKPKGVYCSKTKRLIPKENNPYKAVTRYQKEYNKMYEKAIKRGKSNL